MRIRVGSGDNDAERQLPHLHYHCPRLPRPLLRQAQAAAYRIRPLPFPAFQAGKVQRLLRAAVSGRGLSGWRPFAAVLRGTAPLLPEQRFPEQLWHRPPFAARSAAEMPAAQLRFLPRNRYRTRNPPAAVSRSPGSEVPLFSLRICCKRERPPAPHFRIFCTGNSYNPS